MANMRSATGLNLASATFALLENSWRHSTRRQYQAVWKEWSKFCQNESVDLTSTCVESMLSYLQYLFYKGFAWRSIGVHRSALSSTLEAHKPVPVGQHPLVCRFVRGVLNKRPPSVRVVPTWDIGQVLMYPSKDHPPADLSLFRLTAKVLFLLAAFTAKRVSDLVLLSVDSSLCHVTDECIVFQTQFGSKTDRPGHRFPAPPPPPLPCGNVRRAFAQSGMCRPTKSERSRYAKPAALSSCSSRRSPIGLRRWMVKVMREAGVIASAGSTRATVCPATRRALTTTLELSGLDKGRHALPSLRACSTRADSSFHFVSALLARRCVSST